MEFIEDDCFLLSTFSIKRSNEEFYVEFLCHEHGSTNDRAESPRLERAMARRAILILSPTEMSISTSLFGGVGWIA